MACATTLGAFVRMSVPVVGMAIGLMGQWSAQAERPEGEFRVLGFQRCVDCHELPAEAWQRSSHSRRSLAMLSTNLRAQRYAHRLGISPSEITRDSRCTNCHGTRQQTHDGTVRVDHGVSCESCHGPAGASLVSDGWLELHSEGEERSGPTGVEHAAALQEAGMAGVGDLYSLAVRCYECHCVSDEKVVAVGHVAGSSDFELTIWFSGEVRHNFAPYTVDVEDDEANMLASNVWLAIDGGRKPSGRKRLMYVVGQLADLEVNLRNRAKATMKGTFATSAASRSLAAHARLKQVATHVEISELREAVAAVDLVRPLLFLPPEENHQVALTKAADCVADAAQQFTAKHDGTQLAAIDSLLPREAKGRVFQPQ